MQQHIEKAIKQAVSENGQPPELAVKIIAWMKALTGGTEQIEDGQRTTQRVGVLYEATIVNVEKDGK